MKNPSQLAINKNKNAMTVKPINVNEILSKKIASIPEAMIESVNELLIKNWDGVQSKFKIEDLIDLYLNKIGQGNIEQNRDQITSNRYLDFDSIYEAEGWSVEFDEILKYVFFYKK